jgi:site-specific recombinase XerD
MPDDVHLDEGWLKVFGKGEKEQIVLFGANQHDSVIGMAEVRQSLRH